MWRKELQKQFEEAAKPLMKFIADNFYPHVTVILDSVTAQLVEGVATVKTDEFIKD